MSFLTILSEITVNITITDVLAVWGAFIATLILIWDVIKWKNSGSKVSFEVQTNRILINVPNVDSDRTVTAFRVENIGDRPTTITNIGFHYYKNYFYKLIRKASKQTVFNPQSYTGEIPFFLDIGKVWDGSLYQDSITEHGLNGIYVFRLDVSHKAKPMTKTIKYKEKT